MRPSIVTLGGKKGIWISKEDLQDEIIHCLECSKRKEDASMDEEIEMCKMCKPQATHQMYEQARTDGCLYVLKVLISWIDETD